MTAGCIIAGPWMNSGLVRYDGNRLRPLEIKHPSHTILPTGTLRGDFLVGFFSFVCQRRPMSCVCTCETSSTVKFSKPSSAVAYQIHNTPQHHTDDNFRLAVLYHDMWGTPDHLLLDSTPNLGPLVSRWEINKFENYWYKSVRNLEALKLLFRQFLNLSSSHRDMSDQILGDLSK